MQDRYGLTRFERNEEFYYKDGRKRITRTRINLIPPKTEKWHTLEATKELE